MRDDGNPISPQHLVKIVVCHRPPAPDVVLELPQPLELDDDTLLAHAEAADSAAQGDLAAHPEHAEAVIQVHEAAAGHGASTAARVWRPMRRVTLGSGGVPHMTNCTTDRPPVDTDSAAAATNLEEAQCMTP
jgi:hypothetical protein